MGRTDGSRYRLMPPLGRGIIGKTENRFVSLRLCHCVVGMRSVDCSLVSAIYAELYIYRYSCLL